MKSRIVPAFFVVLRENVLNMEEKINTINNYLEQKTRKHENEIREDYNIHLVNIALYRLYDFININHPTVFVAKKQEFEKAYNELIGIVDDQKYNYYCKAGIKRYNEDCEDTGKASVFQKQFVKKPRELNMKQFCVERFEKAFTSFFNEWDINIQALQRKHAIKNRYQYLVEHAKKYYDIAKEFKNAKIMNAAKEKMQEYQEKANSIEP